MMPPLPPRKPFKPWILALMIAGVVCAFVAAWLSFEQEKVWATRFGIGALAFYFTAIVARRSSK